MIDCHNPLSPLNSQFYLNEKSRSLALFIVVVKGAKTRQMLPIWMEPLKCILFKSEIIPNQVDRELNQAEKNMENTKLEDYNVWTLKKTPKSLMENQSKTSVETACNMRISKA